MLFLTMVAAMYRNWKYPFYLMALYGRKYAEAMLERERSKRDLVVSAPSIDADTGRLRDVQAYLTQFAQDETALNAKIAECQSQEKSAFTRTKCVEPVVLTLIVVGMGMLIVLAWMNF
jgi:hypothetical protein